MIAERIQAKLADIDAQIARIRRDAADREAALVKQRSALERILLLVTPEIEQAVATLLKLGFIHIDN